MYLHLGQDKVVSFRELVGVFDLDNTTYNVKAAQFIHQAEREGRVILCTEDLPKSVVLCDGGVYLSQLSPATLLRRVEQGSVDALSPVFDYTEEVSI